MSGRCLVCRSRIKNNLQVSCTVYSIDGNFPNPRPSVSPLHVPTPATHVLRRLSAVHYYIFVLCNPSDVLATESKIGHHCPTPPQDELCRIFIQAGCCRCRPQAARLYPSSQAQRWRRDPDGEPLPPPHRGACPVLNFWLTSECDRSHMGSARRTSRRGAPMPPPPSTRKSSTIL